MSAFCVNSIYVIVLFWIFSILYSFLVCQAFISVCAVRKLLLTWALVSRGLPWRSLVSTQPE